MENSTAAERKEHKRESQETGPATRERFSGRGRLIPRLQSPSGSNEEGELNDL